jgi:Fic family protein
VLFSAPPIRADEQRALDRVTDLRGRLARAVAVAGPWLPAVERAALARAVHGSLLVDRVPAGLDDALAAVGGEEPAGRPAATWSALTGYRDALRFVGELAGDPHAAVDASLLRGLHFLVAGPPGADDRRQPGRYRSGGVTEPAGRPGYRPPDPDEVPGLVADLTAGLAGLGPPGAPVGPVQAALVHLNLALVAPFRTANGRLARCVHTLLLARDGALSPAFAGIEEDLGAHADAYRAGLAAVGGARWRPDRDARPWLRFLLAAQYRQAGAALRRLRAAGRLGELVGAELAAAGVPDRALPALLEAAAGRPVRRSSYLATARVSEAAGSRDLRALAAAGLLAATGTNRGRCYRATPALAALADRCREPAGAAADPWAPGPAPGC